MADLLIVKDDPHVAERAPDVVLLDVEMPVLSGPGMACLMFVRNRGNEAIPVVLLSGKVGLSRLAAKVGTPYFLAKPYAVAAVMRLVRRVLSARTPPTPGGGP
jgi:FixJ family two-component response regulator